MKNKKLFAAALTAALAVSMMGTSVMAAQTTAEGTTNFTYTPGTAGPVDPVDPGTEEESVNNWMVVYPRSVTLTDTNVETTQDSYTKGAELEFTVKQKQAGADNSDTIQEANIPQGLKVEANGADATGNYTLNGDTEGTATMQIGSFTNVTITSAAKEMGTLTHTEITKSGKAVIRNNSDTVDGNVYTGQVTFTFTNPGTI